MHFHILFHVTQPFNDHISDDSVCQRSIFSSPQRSEPHNSVETVKNLIKLYLCAFKRLSLRVPITVAQDVWNLFTLLIMPLSSYKVCLELIENWYGNDGPKWYGKN